MPELSTRFTPEEVLERLRQDPRANRRTAEVHDAAAQVGLWTSRIDPDTERDLGRTADRLPSAVFWYVQGRTNDDIGRRLRPLGGAWDAELALEVATVLIAGVLNERTASATAHSPA
jgi:hypothetical protein